MSKTTQGEAVTNPADILRLMRALRSDMIPVTLVFTLSRRSLSTYVVEVDDRAGRLLLDEPLPRNMAGELASGATFALTAQVEGVQIRATDLSAEPAPSDGAEPRFQCPLPRHLQSNQRRRSYRAQVRRSLRIDARVRHGQGVDCSGVLRDMSVDGCGIEFEEDVRHRFTELGAILAIRLRFPNLSDLEFQAVLQRRVFDDQSGRTTIGCRFTSMPAQLHLSIATLVTDLQRDRINFLKKGGIREEIPERFLSPEGEPVPVSSPGLSASTASARRPARPARKGAVEAAESVESVWRNTLAAVRRQQHHNRAEPTPDLTEAVQRLGLCWCQQREALIVHSRLRSTDNTDIEQRTARALVLADHCARRDDDSEQTVEDWLMRALLRQLPESLQPLVRLVAAQDDLAYRMVDGQMYYLPTAALGTLHKKGQFEPGLIRSLIGTQGLYPLGGPVRLDNDCIALVLRQDDRAQPLWVRQLYRIGEQSPLPPKDISLDADGPVVLGPADPVKANLPVDLLRPALRR